MNGSEPSNRFGGAVRRWRVPRREETYRDRGRLLRRRWRVVVRLSISTAAAFAIATRLLEHEQAFFAPIAAVIVSLAGAGWRLRTTLELVVGVAVGVLMGELLILTIGRGGWQIGLVVALTLAVSTIIGITGLALTQAVNSAVLLAAVLPAADVANPAVTRFTDALVGGACGLAMVLLLPRNPVRDIDLQVQKLLDRLATVLKQVALALRTDDEELADATLHEARSLQPLMDTVTATALNVDEIARMSPMRWRQRPALQRYVGAVVDLDNALRDARILARRVAAMLRHGESASEELRRSVELLGRSVGIYAEELAAHDNFSAARTELVDSARMAVRSVQSPPSGPGPVVGSINAAAIAVQVRSLSADLLAASGVSWAEIDRILDFD